MRSQSGDRRREELGKLFEYNDWANDRMIAMLENAFGKDTDLRRSEDPRVRAIQEAAAHILAAQIIWLRRWEGEFPTAMSDLAQWPTPAALQHAFAEERARFWQYFQSLYREGQVTRILRFTTTRGVPYAHALWQMMQHAVVHGAYHRGQVTARLLDLGREDAIVSTDLIEFYRETDKTPLEAE